MKISLSILAACAAWAPCAAAQPLAKPLADFDRMVNELKTSGVMGEPLRVGNTTIVTFSAVQFGLGSAGAAIGAAGGLGARSVPMGVLIVEGDDVRMEVLPRVAEKPAASIQQLIQGIIEKKVTFMVNGINLGSAPGSVGDLAPMMQQMMGQRTVIVNGLNLGNLRAPRPSGSEARSMAELEKAAQEKPSAETWFELGEAQRKAGQPAKAADAYQNALRLKPGYPAAARALADVKK